MRPRPTSFATIFLSSNHAFASGMSSVSDSRSCSSTTSIPRSRILLMNSRWSRRAFCTHITSSKSSELQLVGVNRSCARPGAQTSTLRNSPTSECTPYAADGIVTGSVMAQPSRRCRLRGRRLTARGTNPAIVAELGTSSTRSWPTSGAREDDELLGRSGHRDIAVDRSFDAHAERLWVDEDDQVELEPLRQLRGQRPDAGRRPERGIADDAGDPVGMRGEPAVEDRAQIRSRSVYDGDVGAADGGRHVGVREDGPDDRLGFGHDPLRRPVVDAQGGQVDLVEPDPLDPFLPRLREPVPGLNTVPNDD